jgi:hypothetical protein
MRRRLLLIPILVLALAAPALANDFIQKPPVPSARDRGKPPAKKQQTPVSWKNLQKPDKITKTIKPKTTSTGSTTAQ